MKIAFFSVKGKGIIGIAEITLLDLFQSAIAMDTKTAKKITAALGTYPDLYNKLRIAVQEMINRLSQLIIIE